MNFMNFFLERENIENINFEADNTKVEKIIQKIKSTKSHKKDDSSECSKIKVISYLYQHTINFLPNERNDPSFPMYDKLLKNVYHIYNNRPVIHHSHVSEKIIGFAHEYCNSQVRENYYNIPVIAHHQFRFDFFLFLKGLRPTVWETTDIHIGGKNTTDINFAIIQNQVRFIDTVKYLKQSLASLASSMTEIEQNNVRKNFKNFKAFS